MLSWSKPVPKASPARLWSTRRRMNSRWRAALSSWKPVVSRSSPPDSHGVGSRSSVMCTHRTGTSAPSSPAVRLRPMSWMSDRTVSKSASFLVPDDPVPGLAQHGPEDRVDLLELLRVGHERGRQLDHWVATVVGAADESLAEELTGEEAAQELLRLVVVEALLGLLVLHE